MGAAPRPPGRTGPGSHVRVARRAAGPFPLDPLAATGAISFGGAAALAGGQASIAAAGSILFGGAAGLHMLVTPSTPPAGFTYFYRVSETMPTPTLGTFGNPVNWVPSSRVDTAWGRVRILIDGVDMTFARGVPAVVEEFVHAKPLGPLTAKLRFPQFSIFDQVGGGDLTPLVKGAYVELDWIKPDETFGGVLWDGLLMPVQHKRGEELTQTGLILNAIGVGHQIGLYRRAPGISNRPYDIGERLVGEWDLASRANGRWIPPASVTTGILTSYRGNWESVVDFLNRLTEDSLQADGTQWYCMEIPPRQIVVRQTPTMSAAQWHVSAGGNGVVLDVTNDPSVAADIFYGEAVDPAGATLRNMYTDAEFGLGVPFFQPWAYDPLVHGIDPGPKGTLVNNEARTDQSLIRQEAYMGRGQGVTYDEMTSIAQAALALVGGDPGWQGKLTLSQAPEEDHQILIKADDNIAVRYVNGSGPAGLIFNVAQMRCKIGEATAGTASAGAAGNPVVELTVDTKARTLPTLLAVMQRQRDLAQNPVKRLLTGKSSGLVADKTVLWDATRSGWVPNGGHAFDVNGNARAGNLGFRWADTTATVSCPGGQWTFVQFLASQTDTIVNALFQTSPAVEFCAAIFDRPPLGNTLPVNPFGVGPPSGDDTLRASPGYQIHWGNPGQPAGFSPRFKYNPDGSPTGATLTGTLEDQAQWPYKHATDTSGSFDPAVDGPAFLWAAVWPTATTTIYGQISRLDV